MTTIAWDGRDLVGDRRLMNGNTPTVSPRPKVHRLIAPNGRVALFGFSGASAVADAWLHWLAGGDEPRWPADDERWSAMMIDDTGMVWLRFSGVHAWTQHGRKAWAIGSGCDYALGAMTAGSGARRAVQVAALLDVGTGDGIDVVRLQQFEPQLDWRR